MITKIKNGSVDLAPSSIVHGKSKIFNPTMDVLSLHGFKDQPVEEIKRAIIDIIHPRVKYSKEKIILTLGKKWPSYRDELISQNLIDHLIVIDDISDNDKLLADFLAKVKNDLGEKLKDCVLDE